MKLSGFVFPLAGLVTIAFLTGCPGGSDSPGYDESKPVTTTIPKDDVSDLSDNGIANAMGISKIATSCASSCALANLVEHDDFLSVAFDLLTQNVRVFSFRSGWGKCALTLTAANSGMVKMDTYNKWDPDMYAEPKNLHFTISKSNPGGDYCVPNGSVWEKVDCRTQAPDQIMRLRRLDKPSGEEILISTYKGWKGTLMAKKSGVIHPMACQ